MKLRDLLKNMEYRLIGSDDIGISSICYDSRKAEKDSLFFCIRGFNTDGHKYAPSVAEKGGMRVICVVMGSQSEYEKNGYTVKVQGGYGETTNLLNFAFNGYKAVQILHPNQIVKQADVANGDALLSFGAKDSAFSVIPSNIQTEDLIYRYVGMPELAAPMEKGQNLGVLQIWCGTVCVAETELVGMNTVTVKNGQVDDYSPRTNSSGLWSAALTVVGVLVVIIAIVYLVRKVQIQKHRASARNRVRSR